MSEENDPDEPLQTISHIASAIGDQHPLPINGAPSVTPKNFTGLDTYAGQKVAARLNKENLSIKLGKGPYTAIVTEVVNPAPSAIKPNTIAKLESSHHALPKRDIKVIIKCKVVGIETSIFGTSCTSIGNVELIPKAGVTDIPRRGQIIMMEYINPPGDDPTTTNQGYYLGPKYDDKNELSRTRPLKPTVLSEVCKIEGLPLEHRIAQMGPSGPLKKQDLPSIKQPRNSLKTCAEGNDWAGNLSATTLAPPEVKEGKRFYKPRPSYAEVRAIVYHDGVPSIKKYVAKSEAWQPNTFKPFTHYYIDSSSKVHELVDPKYVANHLFRLKMSDSGESTIGINTSQFTLNLHYIFENNVYGPKLRPEYKSLLSGDGRNGALLIGSPAFLGMPTPVGRITGRPGHDVYLVGSKTHLETCYQLTSCLAKEFGIETSNNAILEYTREKLKSLEVPTFDTIPFFFNQNALKNYTSFSESKMQIFNGVFSESRYGHAPGGLINEFYSVCRMNDLSKEESYYATLAALVCPGNATGGAVNYVDLESYRTLFGEFYVDTPAVPAPISTKVKDFLISIGKQLFLDANFHREFILYKDKIANQQSAFGGIGSGLIAATALTDKTPWNKIAKDIALSYDSNDCIQFYESFRLKLFNSVKKYDESISESDIKDYKSALGMWISENALKMLEYAVKIDEGKNLAGCLTNEGFLKKLHEDYSIQANKIIG